MRKVQLIAALVAVAIACRWTLGSAHAAIIQLEAESAGTLGASWSVTANASALGGNVIRATAGGGDTMAAGRATYSVNFPQAGMYDLYLRVVMAPNGSTDSLWLGNNFGVAPTIQENNLGFVGATPNSTLNGLPLVPGQSAALWQNIAAAGNLIWINLSANIRETVPLAAANNNEMPALTVASPGTLSYLIGTREIGMSVDALAFALSSEASLVRVGADGNLAVVPEPATCVLFGMAGLLPLGWRRRTS